VVDVASCSGEDMQKKKKKEDSKAGTRQFVDKRSIFACVQYRCINITIVDLQ